MKDSAAPEGGSEISIEKLESQLNTLKTMFAEKQKLVSDLDAYGPAGGESLLKPTFTDDPLMRLSIFIILIFLPQAPPLPPWPQTPPPPQQRRPLPPPHRLRRLLHPRS